MTLLTKEATRKAPHRTIFTTVGQLLNIEKRCVKFMSSNAYQRLFSSMACYLAKNGPLPLHHLPSKLVREQRLLRQQHKVYENHGRPLALDLLAVKHRLPRHRFAVRVLAHQTQSLTKRPPTKVTLQISAD